jgi:hypothetical protein
MAEETDMTIDRKVLEYRNSDFVPAIGQAAYAIRSLHWMHNTNPHKIPECLDNALLATRKNSILFLYNMTLVGASYCLLRYFAE